MTTSLRLLRLAAAGVLLLTTAAVALFAMPTVVRGQTVRERPLEGIRTRILGGPQIGVQLRDIEEADRTREKLDALAGAVVEAVEADSPAARAGFRAGDVVTTFDGERIRSARQLARLIEETPDGREVRATVVRAGTATALQVTPEAQRGLGALGEIRNFYYSLWPETARRELDSPEREPFVVRPQIQPPADLRDLRAPDTRLGVTVQALTDQLAAYFGVTEGVLVSGVEEGTPAATAGLKAGDVITRIGDRAVGDRDAAVRALRGVSGEVELTIVRDRRTERLTVRLR